MAILIITNYSNHLIMKLQSMITSIIICLFLSLGITAQEGKAQAFLIHEDQVKPSMMDRYEKVSKDLVEACKENKVEGIQWNVASMEDGTYLAITPIENMSDIQNMNFEDLREKVGDEKFTKMFENFNECYDNHGDYITMLMPSLSYMPDGLSTTTPGKEYRVWHRLDVSAGNLQKLESKLKDLKDLFASKNSKMYYRIYKSGFGNVGDFYTAVISAEDAADYDMMSRENQKLMGEEGKKAFDEVFEYVEAYTVKRGGMRPDLAYQPSNTNISKD